MQRKISGLRIARAGVERSGPANYFAGLFVCVEIAEKGGNPMCRLAGCVENLPPRVYSRALVSITMVAGPSLTRATFISAPNSPVATVLPKSAASLLRNIS